jgi:tripartite-type tricarboxylate transporter receptor subunit TctC
MTLTQLSQASFGALACFALPTHVAAQAAIFPAKPVRMIVPLAPGGGSDIVGRIVAQGLTELWERPVIVDNRPGAGSAVGTSIAAKASPDGYTLLVSSSSIAISPALYRNLDFDIVRDFSGVTLLASQPSMLVVHPSVAAASIKDLIALAHGQKLSYGSAGVGSATHLGTELLLYAAKMPMLHVPYKSAGLATTALLAGETQVLLTNMASVVPHVAAGRVKAVGISSKKRSPVAPQVPTLDESGLPGFEYATWYAMLVPARVKPALVTEIQSATAKVLRSPAIAKRLESQGLEIHATTAAEFGRFLESELARWDSVVKAADIKVGQ